MKPCRVAKKAPAKPPNMAPVAKAVSLALVVLMPSERQAISSSRMASQARPTGSRRRRRVTKAREQREPEDHVIEEDDGGGADRERQAEEAAKPFRSVALKGKPKKVGRGMSEMPLWPVGHMHPVDAARGGRSRRRRASRWRDSRRAAAAPGSRASCPRGRRAAGERQAASRSREPKMVGEQRVGIGADRVEGDIAEVEQAGEPDHDVEAPAEHHVDQDLDAEIVDPLAVELDVRSSGKDEDRDKRRASRAAVRRSWTIARSPQAIGAGRTPAGRGLSGCRAQPDEQLRRSAPTKTMATRWRAAPARDLSIELVVACSARS